MFAYAIAHCLFVILLILFIKNISDTKTIAYIIFVNLCFEFILSMILFVYTSSTGVTIYCNLGSLNILPNSVTKDIILIYDSTTFSFHSILFVALMSCLVFLIQYFEYDFNNQNIILMSSLFSQLAFIFFCTYDLFSIICLWEWISIVSFFLVQYWSIRISTLKAAIKVFFISQVGDFFFLISLFLIISVFETTDLSVILTSNYKINNLYLCNSGISYSQLISILLSMSLFLKSAQFIFFPWLLDAMEAPVPISSQLHSSTLVIIGFYVFYRFQDLIVISDTVKFIYFIFSFFTIITSTFLGFFQDDGKRLLACSTASQLGYVILCISLGFINESLLLLVFVCCNKAFTFIWFGVVMDKNGGVSDIRVYKNLKLNIFEKLGLTFSTLNSTISLGSINWQIKGLLSKGLLVYDSNSIVLGLEILNITWFLSSIYLIKLYLSLFSLTYKGANSVKILNNKLNLFLVNKVNSRYFFFWLVMFLVSLLLSPILNFWIILFH